MRWKNLILTLAAIPALCLLQSCDAGKEETLMNDLTEGYWREEQDENKLLVRFSGSESLFYYACSGPDKTGRYDAYYDTSNPIRNTPSTSGTGGSACSPTHGTTFSYSTVPPSRWERTTGRP